MSPPPPSSPMWPDSIDSGRAALLVLLAFCVGTLVGEYDQYRHDREQKLRLSDLKSRAANVVVRDLKIEFDDLVLPMTIRFTGLKSETKKMWDKVQETGEQDEDLAREFAIETLLDLVAKWEIADDNGNPVKLERVALSNFFEGEDEVLTAIVFAIMQAMGKARS